MYLDEGMEGRNGLHLFQNISLPIQHPRWTRSTPIHQIRMFAVHRDREPILCQQPKTLHRRSWQLSHSCRQVRLPEVTEVLLLPRIDVRSWRVQGAFDYGDVPFTILELYEQGIVSMNRVSR